MIGNDNVSYYFILGVGYIKEIVEIEAVRESMIEVALKRGFTAKETIELSRKLDALLNQVSTCKLSEN